MIDTNQLPGPYKADILRAADLLASAGCRGIFLFGSLASGEEGDHSDIDIAVRGCPEGEFFHLLGRLFLELDHRVDLVDLDSEDPFARYLEEEGRLVQVG